MCDESALPFGSMVGNTAPPGAGRVGGQYYNLLRQYTRGVPLTLDTEQEYKPQFVDEALGNVESATPDWLNLYGTSTGTAGDIIGGANSLSRWYNIGDVAGGGGAAADAVRSINPEVSALTDALTQTASSQLAAGTRLDPADVNRITQSVRSDWSNRGLGTSPPAELDEAVQQATAGQNVLAQREGLASQAISANDWITNPALALTTGTSSAPAAGMQLQNEAAAFTQGAGPTLIDPSSNYDIFNTTYNANAAGKIAAANNYAQVAGGALSY